MATMIDVRSDACKPNDDCEQYQELLCIPDKERSQEEQQMLEVHLHQCAACSSFREENEQLFSLVRNLPAPELDLGLSLELEALLQIERTIESLQSEATKTDYSYINSGPLSRKVVINTNESLARYIQPRIH